MQKAFSVTLCDGFSFAAASFASEPCKCAPAGILRGGPGQLAAAGGLALGAGSALATIGAVLATGAATGALGVEAPPFPRNPIAAAAATPSATTPPITSPSLD